MPHGSTLDDSIEATLSFVAHARGSTPTCCSSLESPNLSSTCLRLRNPLSPAASAEPMIRVSGAVELPPLRRVPWRSQEHRFLTGGEQTRVKSVFRNVSNAWGFVLYASAAMIPRSRFSPEVHKQLDETGIGGGKLNSLKQQDMQAMRTRDRL